MRYTGIYAQSKRASLTIIWSFVAGYPFPEPPPKFKLSAALTIIKSKRKEVVVVSKEAKATPSKASLKSNAAALATGLQAVLGDPFQERSTEEDLIPNV